MGVSLIKCTMQQGPHTALTTPPKISFSQERAKNNSWSHRNQRQDLYVLKSHICINFSHPSERKKGWKIYLITHSIKITHLLKNNLHQNRDSHYNGRTNNKEKR